MYVGEVMAHPVHGPLDILKWSLLYKVMRPVAKLHRSMDEFQCLANDLDLLNDLDHW